MKIIIAGVGKVGSTLTRQLSASGYDITLIDVKQQVLESNVEKYDVMAVLGNCATMETLLQAGVKDADGTKYSTNSSGVLTKIDGVSVSGSDYGREANEPIWKH